MTSITKPNYLVRRPIETAVRQLARALPKEATVYDVGCGHKPYAHLFEAHNYLGADMASVAGADVKYTAGEPIPLSDNSADMIICTQTLQHSQNPQQLMDELYRLLKPGGTALVTVPFGIKLVAEPYFSHARLTTWRDDYWRFTKYGLLLLLGRFQIVSVQETTGYLGTLLQLANYFIASLRIGYIALPFYVIANGFALVIDNAVRDVTHHSSRTRFFYEAIYCSFTSNYIAIVKKP